LLMNIFLYDLKYLLFWGSSFFIPLAWRENYFFGCLLQHFVKISWKYWAFFVEEKEIKCRIIRDKTFSRKIQSLTLFEIWVLL
jgi:hypothetical protein